MSKAKLAATKELIQEKEYRAALAVLKTIPDDPTAEKWLAQLHKYDTVEPAQPKSSRRTPIIVGVICLIIGIAIGGSGKPVATQSVAQIPTATIVTTPGPSPTFTPSATITDTPQIDTQVVNIQAATFTITFPTAQPGLLMTMEPVTYYTQGQSRLRSCAQTSCDTLVTLQAGEAITVNGALNGEEVDTGNQIWYRVDYNGVTAYVYSRLVSLNKPTTPTVPVHVVFPTNPPPISQPVAPPANGVTCGGATTCTQMTSCQQAYACLAGGQSSLDRDGDGVPCESICPGG